MAKTYFFQRYHNKENRHSSATCLLLSLLYNHDSDLFYNLVSNVFNVDKDDLTTSFLTQIKNGPGKSIPDFVISQYGFGISVEAKEKSDTSNLFQLDEHSKSLLSNQYNYNFIILLIPSIGQKDINNVEHLKEKHKQIQYTILTYTDLYKLIKELLVEIRDDNMINILEDYYDYCEDEGLLDKGENTIMIRLSRDTIDWNIKNELYFDIASHKYTGFDYIGLYKDKEVKYIGKIRTIAICRYNSGKLVVVDKVRGTLTKNDEKTIESSMKMQCAKGNNMSLDYAYFLVEKYINTNFVKKTKYSLYGRKKIYLPDYGISTNKTELIAEELKNYTW